MFDPNYKGYQDKFPNIIYKRKLAALPLFNQNQTPTTANSLATPTPTTTNTPKLMLASNSTPKFMPSRLRSFSSPSFLNEFKTVNNYTRLCDQPFLDNSNFHFEQMVGNGSGKRRVVLDPIKKKQEKKKIQKMYTIAVSSSNLISSTIKIEEGGHSHPSKLTAQNTIDPHGVLENLPMGRTASQLLQIQNSIKEEQEEQEANTVEEDNKLTNSQVITEAQVDLEKNAQAKKEEEEQQTATQRSKAGDKTERPDSPTRIKKMYKIGDYEAIVGFASLEVVLEPVEDDGSKKLNTRLAKSDLKRIFKRSEKEIVQLVIEGIKIENGKLIVVLNKQRKLSVIDTPQGANSAMYMADENYPTKKTDIHVELGGKKYQASIKFPYLDIKIEALEFYEQSVLKPRYLANLFEEKFNNMQDYLENFNIPPQVYKGKEELHEDELRALPAVIKKVIKTEDFGGLMLFKSMEVNLKNTSTDIVPETTTGEGTTVAEKIAKRRKKDVNNAQIKISISDLRRLLKCDVEEIIELIKESVKIEEGQGFSANFDPEHMNVLKHRHENKLESFPEATEKFTVRFNKFLYEVYIRFPTLELYVPETNFKDVIQLTPVQLEALIADCFNNMQDYMSLFKKPRTQVEQEMPTLALLVPPSENNTKNEFAKLVATSAKKLGYTVCEGLMCKPIARLGSQEEAENNQQEEVMNYSDNIIIEQLTKARYAVFAWETTAKTTANQSNTLKAFLKGLSTGVKEALKEKKIFFIAETSENDEGLEEDLTKQWRAGLSQVEVKLLKNLVVVKDDEASTKVEERLKNIDQALKIEREETEDN